MITANKEIEKVDHFLIQDSIDHIPNGSAENQDQPDPDHFIFLRRLMKKYQDSNNGDDREPDEQIRLIFRRPIRTQTERHSGIANMGERKKIINHHYKMVLRDMGIDPHFSVLIQNDQNIGSQE